MNEYRNDYEQIALPDGLSEGTDGAHLLRWLLTTCEGVDASMPLVMELCQISNRLAEVRKKVREQGLMISAARGRSQKNPLLDIEVRLVASYSRIWSQLGLADKSDDDESEKRPVGRPPGSNEDRLIRKLLP